MNDPEYFGTTNKPLAFALALAGCKWAPQKEGGPAINVYTLSFLRTRRELEGKGVEEAAKILFDRQVPGQVTYRFERDETFRKAIAAWDAQHEEFKKAADRGVTPTAPDVSIEHVMQVCFYMANSATEFNKAAFVNRPLVSTISGNESRDGDKTIVSGRGKVWTVGASDAIKSHLKV